MVTFNAVFISCCFSTKELSKYVEYTSQLILSFTFFNLHAGQIDLVSSAYATNADGVWSKAW